MRFLTALVLAAALALPTAGAHAATAHDFAFEAIEGGPLPLSQYAGKALLVVNTASQCGFTPQYEGLQALWTAYKDRGLVVLGVPSNDFGGQEPGSNEDIKTFCEVNFAVDFPMTMKVAVTGTEAHPFYQWARSVDKGAVPRWNFTKFLIGPDGTLVETFGSTTKPDSKKLIAAVEAVLPKSQP
jgi:glutathione peroxidase